MDNLTAKAKEILETAQWEANSLFCPYIGSEHLLLGILKSEKTWSHEVFARFGISYEKVKERTSDFERFERRIEISGSDMSPALKKIIKNASILSKSMGHRFTGSEHLAFALLCMENCVGWKIIELEGLNPGEIKNAIFENESELYKDVRDKSNHGDKSIGVMLSRYADDLNERALRGDIDPVIGREREIERVIRILCRRRKNNPCLVGLPGVGKTAIAEGLALLMVKGNVPEVLKDRRIYSLDLSLMIAGTKYRGEFEERLKGLLEECERDKTIVLFIDEVHTVIGAGGAEGALDAANIIKPALARGKIRLIGATTNAEYSKYIERDAALERRFGRVDVPEPSTEDSIRILKGLREKYEDYHGIRISDEAIESAVELSSRHIVTRYLPDKAIDLIDEAASGAVMEGKEMIGKEDIEKALSLMTSQRKNISVGFWASDSEKRQ